MNGFLQKAFAIGALFLTTVPAAAQTFTRAPGWHLEPQAGTYSSAGVGSPTVVYRKKFGDFVMFFESRISRPDADCTVGYWGISTATSPDGLTWTQAPSQSLPNLDGTYFECVAAHPYAVIDDNGEDIHLWFKGEQGAERPATRVPSPGDAPNTPALDTRSSTRT